MRNADYDLLMREMDDIASKLELFPDSLKEAAFKTMVDTLLQESRIANVSYGAASDNEINTNGELPSLEDVGQEVASIEEDIRDIFQKSTL